MDRVELVVVGAGPAGMTAALYAARGGLSTVVYDKGMPGGLIASTDRIENYPGVESISGFELAGRMRKQAESFGARFRSGELKSIRKEGSVFSMDFSGESVESKAVIFAAGSVPRKLGVDGEERLTGRGVSYCATCDGPFFRGKDIVVVGCGSSGLQEGLFLLGFVRSITYVEFLPYVTGERVLYERNKERENVSFLLNHKVVRIEGEDSVESVVVVDRRTGEEKRISVSGVFIYVGFLPASGPVAGLVERDKDGYIITDEGMATSTPGLFAAGDIRKKPLRQVVTAASDGASAAFSAIEYIKELGK
ncbi:FAD-dependent oxidoreductase [bacterium]|nr:FAD-dependent oxidoreductase [bacterium]